MTTLGIRNLALSAAVLLAGGLAACGDDGISEPEPEQADVPPPETITAVPYNSVLNEVVDENCAAAEQLDPSTPLYHIEFPAVLQGACAPAHPLTAPDGRRLTAEEWVQASGEATIACVDGGTGYDFQFEGLVPEGVYTIWHFTPTGSGALASHPGDIDNAFSATAAGTANFSVIGSAGPMTMSGEVPACTLPVPAAAELENPWGVIFILVYHKDNRTWGETAGPFDTVVGQLMFRVQ